MTISLQTAIRIPRFIPPGTRRVYLVFNLTRGTPLSAMTISGLLFEPHPRIPNALRTPDLFPLDEHETVNRPHPHGEPLPFPPDEIVTAEVQSEDEMVEPVRYVVETDDEVVGLHSEDAPCLDPDALWVDSQSPLNTQLLDPVAYHNALELTLGDPTLPFLNDRWFFFDLDRHTATHLRDVYLPSTTYDPADVKRHINELMLNLPQRLKRRHGDYVGGTPYTMPTSPAPDPLLGALRYLSRLFTDLFKRHLHTPGGDPDPVAIGNCFDRFANGELRLLVLSGVWTTQPSSGYYFLFGELAMMCVECGVAPTAYPHLWEDLVNSFVRSQEMFGAVYSPCVAGAQPKMLDYCSCSFDSTKQLIDKSALLTAYSAKTFAGLCESAAMNTHTILPGEL